MRKEGLINIPFSEAYSGKVTSTQFSLIDPTYIGKNDHSLMLIFEGKISADRLFFQQKHGWECLTPGS